jgi:phosphatidate cytidylyltransferase
MSEKPEPKKLSKGATFVRRLGSTLVLWAVVVVSFFLPNRQIGDAVLFFLSVTLVGVGLREYFNMARESGLPHCRPLGIVAGLVLTGVTFCLARQGTEAAVSTGDFEIAFIGLTVVVAWIHRFATTRNGSSIVAVGTTVFGVLYIAVRFDFVLKIFYMPGVNGAWMTFFFFVVTKFSDAGAYAVGSLVGKHKMIPSVSPGKTWEGFAGALLVPTLLGLVLVLTAGEKLVPLTWPIVIVLCLVLGASAVVGDLVASILKREAKIKDSGNFFPGIGGVIDLLDSPLFNAPIMYIALRILLAS